MPTNRRRRVREMVDRTVPAWAQRLLETGEEPARDSPEYDAFFGYAFCNEAVPGLPPADELLWGARGAYKPRRRATASSLALLTSGHSVAGSQRGLVTARSATRSSMWSVAAAQNEQGE